MFGRRGEVDGEIAYTTPDGRTEHLLVDLKRSTNYLLSLGDDKPKPMKSSPEGTVRFVTDRAGAVKLVASTGP